MPNHNMYHLDTIDNLRFLPSPSFLGDGFFRDGLYFCTGPPPPFTGDEISPFAGALFADFAMTYTTGGNIMLLVIISLYYETGSSVAFYIIC